MTTPALGLWLVLAAFFLPTAARGQAPTIINSPTSPCFANVAYTFTYFSTGSPTFTLTSGALPTGMTLSSSGTISGTPTKTGIFTGTVTASNGTAPDATQNFTIVVVSYLIPHTFASFEGNPSCPLVYNQADSNFWGATQSTSGGLLYRMAPFGTGYQTGHAFSTGDLPSGLVSVYPINPSILGITEGGGTAGGGSIYNADSLNFNTLYSFNTGIVTSEGTQPKGALIKGPDGFYYGVTAAGGYNDGTSTYGTVYRLQWLSSGAVLHRFKDGSVASDGAVPLARLCSGSDGNLYGTTSAGGIFNQGTVFKMSTLGATTILHNFQPGTLQAGTVPKAGLIQASDGNFYGTASTGGQSNKGTVFRMTPAGVVTVLHSFGGTLDGATPLAELVQATDGNLYGTTSAGGRFSQGNIYQLTLSGSYVTVYNFGGSSDGSGCQAALVQFSNYLYGVCKNGGSQGFGIVFQLTPPASPPIITSPATANFAIGVANTFTVIGTGLPAVTGYSATGLPSWASINATSGKITGTPPDATGSPFTVNVTATNGTTPNATQVLTINVVPAAAPAFANGPPPATIALGALYNFTYQVTGAPTPTFSLSAGTLPLGLTLSSSGVLSGVPSTAGLYTGTMKITNSIGNATQDFSITVTQAPVFGNGPPTSPARVGTAYSFTFQSSSYPAPAYTVTAGNLPPGLTLSSAGVLSGTPTQAGVFTGTITADNGVGTAATQNFSITVQVAPTITNSLPATLLYNQTMSFTYQATGNPTPQFSYSGNLPPGLNFSNSGVISGKPLQTGTYSLTVTAYNTVGSVQQPVTLVIQRPPTNVSTPIAPYNRVTVSTFYSKGNNGYAIEMLAYPAPTFTLSGNLPTGMSMSSSGVISGTPTQVGTYPANVVVSNGVSPDAVVPATITVAPNPVKNYTVLSSLGSPSAVGLIWGADGKLYGLQGDSNSMTAFTITPQGTYTSLHTFTAAQGRDPAGPLLLAPDATSTAWPIRAAQPPSVPSSK